MKVEKRKTVPEIKEYAIVRVKECGNVTEIMAREHEGNGGGVIKKLSKDHYLDKRNGEIKEYTHYENRADDTKSIARSLERGRDMLNANITDVSKCRWLTLTYAENMTDDKKLMFDFKNFNTRCREKFGHYEYITAAEPQGRGAWHLHVVLIFENTAPYMPNEEVRELWKKGFVTIKKLDNVDNVGSYLTAYLGDMELTEDAKGIDPDRIKLVEYEEDGQKKTKRYIKGARMYMYPRGFRIFRYSRGCKKPIVSQQFFHEAKKKVCSHKQTFRKAIDISDEVNGFSDTLVYEYYNATLTECQAESGKNAKIGKSHK